MKREKREITKRKSKEDKIESEERTKNKIETEKKENEGKRKREAKLSYANGKVDLSKTYFLLFG